ncbi:MAG: phosphotransferase [Pseudomonadales bacterium]
MNNHTDIPLSLAEVDGPFLTSALREAGVLQKGEVVDIHTRVIGQGAGFMGEVVDLRLTLSEESPDVPTQLILKIPTASRNRRIGQTLGIYEREIRFYRELQPRLGIRTPRHLYSAMDLSTDPHHTLKALKWVNRMPIWLIRPALPLLGWLGRRKTNRYILIIENLGGYRVGDQVAGCSIEDAKVALKAMARMHAQFWNSGELTTLPWLVPIELIPKPIHMMFLKTLNDFKIHHEGWLTNDHITVLNWLKLHFIDLVKHISLRPHTLLHGDFRLDNLCFDDTRGEIILFDWQTLGTGPIGSDLAYFLSSSMSIDTNQNTMAELIEYYRHQLADNDVSITPEALQWEYETGLLTVLHRTVPAQFQNILDFGDGRGNDLIDTWIQRVFSKLSHVDPNRLLEKIPRS